MAEAIVSAILEQLASVIHQQTEEGVRLLLGVDEEVEMLSSNFHAIQAVLNDAEKKQVKDSAVRLWLDKLKNTSYDIEDVLDEWNTIIAKLHVKEVEDASNPLRKVCSPISYYLCCCRRVVLRCDIAVKIKNLNRTLDVLAKEKDRFKFSLTEGIENLERQMTTSFIDLSEVCGRDQDKDTLVSLLLSESSQGTNLPIIAIVGLGGIGKTTLAQLAFSDDKVTAHFDYKIWVCVSDPFDEIRIAKAILESLQDIAANLDELETLFRKIHQYLKGKKFLLILDDVWIEDPNKWEKLKYTLNCGSKGSTIVITTRKEKTASVMGTTKTNMILIGILSDKESWSLFSRIAFFGRPREELKGLEYIGREIVGKCKGLPLAIKTLGSFLRFKGKIEEWEKVLGSELWELEEVEKGLFPPLLLSYYDLPFQLRKCFSYCATFPKDHVMEKDTLVKLWMAQGYLISNRNKDMERVGEEYFENLVIRSFFQDFEKSEYNDSIIRCKMHDIVHDFAQFLTKNECLIIEDTSHANPQMHPSYQNVRHLMIMKDMNLFPIHTEKKLRSLVIDDQYHLVKNMSQLVKELTCLRTLSISGGEIEKLPKGIKNLVHLRYLKLDRDTGIKELPEKVCGLYNLQTLDLIECLWIEKLPRGIEKLVNLRHLLIDGTISLKYMPKGLERLTALKPLSKFVIAGSHHANKALTSLECLKKWNYSHGYFVLNGLGNVRDVSAVKAADFKSKKNLFDLTLSFDCDDEVSRIEKHEVILEELQPPPNLLKLWIKYYGGKTMSFHSMESSTNLRELTLQDFSYLECFPPLGKLQSLESLNLWELKSIKRVSDEFLGIENNATSSSSSSSSIIAFPKLKALNISFMVEWEEWNYEVRRSREGDITIMPSLYSLSMRSSPKLKALPDYLLQSITLEKLEILNCSLLSSDKMGIFSHIDKIIFPNLRELTFEGGGHEEENRCFPPLGRLPSLESLSIIYFPDIKRVGNEILGIESGGASTSSMIVFPKLTTLEFESMFEWEEWDITKKRDEDVIIMPCLRSLSIKWCHKLKALPDHVLQKQTLQKLIIDDCSILQKLYEEGGKEWSKISHISDLTISAPFHQPIYNSESESPSVVAHSANEDVQYISNIELCPLPPVDNNQYIPGIELYPPAMDESESESSTSSVLPHSTNNDNQASYRRRWPSNSHSHRG